MINPEDLRHKTGTTSSGENPPANATTPEAETSENETPHFTKESPYPVEDEQLYLMQFKDEHDTLNFLVRGIQNASRQAYEVIKARWDEGYFYHYDREHHKKVHAEFRAQREKYEQVKADLQNLLNQYQDEGDESKVGIISQLLANHKENSKLFGLLNDLELAKQNENFWYLMQMPMEEAIRFVHHGKYSTLDLLESRSRGGYQYEGFELEKTKMIK